MTRRKLSMFALVLAAGLISGGPFFSPVTAADANAYFDALIGRPSFWKGYSFRPRAGAPVSSPYFSEQLGAPRDGGYQMSNSNPRFVSYDAHMDAAKVVIPMWVAPGFDSPLGTSMTAASTRLYPAAWTGSYGQPGRQVKIDNEIMVITAPDPNTESPRGATVARGQYGTTAAPHAAGATMYVGNNSLPHQLRVPLNTEDGNVYVFTWDAFYTSSFVGTGLAAQKSWQFSSGGDAIWLEVKTRMDGGSDVTRPPNFRAGTHVGGVDVRSYNRLGGLASWLSTDGSYLGPAVVKNTPIEPAAGTFTLHPDRWTRYWVRVDQRANDYDYFDLWVADEVQNPVLVYSRVPISVRPPDFSIRKFWIQFNDSNGRLPNERMLNPRDLVLYARNFAALKNAGDISPLLQRPVPGALPGPEAAAPSAPRNVRIVTN